MPSHLIKRERKRILMTTQSPYSLSWKFVCLFVVVVCLLKTYMFYAVACWGGSIRKRDAGRVDRLVRKAVSVVGMEIQTCNGQ